MTEFRGLMSFTLDGQRYDLVGRQDHTTRDGREIELLVWSAACHECGALFFTATPPMPNLKAMSRRCQGCKSPGKKVKGHGHG